MLYIIFVSFLTDFSLNSPPFYTTNFSAAMSGFCYNETLLDVYEDEIPVIEARVRFSQYMALVLSLINILKEVIAFFLTHFDIFATDYHCSYPNGIIAEKITSVGKTSWKLLCMFAHYYL